MALSPNPQMGKKGHGNKEEDAIAGVRRSSPTVPSLRTRSGSLQMTERNSCYCHGSGCHPWKACPALRKYVNPHNNPIFQMRKRSLHVVCSFVRSEILRGMQSGRRRSHRLKELAAGVVGYRPVRAAQEGKDHTQWRSGKTS